MAQMMAPLLSYYDTDVVLVHVPTANNRVRERGYDHALILSKQCGKYTSLPTAQLLKRKGRAHQVGSSRAQRLRQLQGAFRVTQRADIREKYIILVDDVLTSGATLETAARELRRVGAKQVDALVFAQAVR
jgi:ComF family protein